MFQMFQPKIVKWLSVDRYQRVAPDGDGLVAPSFYPHFLLVELSTVTSTSFLFINSSMTRSAITTKKKVKELLYLSVLVKRSEVAASSFRERCIHPCLISTRVSTHVEVRKKNCRTKKMKETGRRCAVPFKAKLRTNH